MDNEDTSLWYGWVSSDVSPKRESKKRLPEPFGFHQRQQSKAPVKEPFGFYVRKENAVQKQIINGGKPSKGTPADKRLTQNKPKVATPSKPAQPKPAKKG